MSRFEPNLIVGGSSRRWIFGAARFESRAALPGNRNRQGRIIAARAFGAFIGVALLIAAAHTSNAAAQPDPSLEIYGRAQQLVDIGGRRLNLFCLGHGSPTVILSGGLGASSFEWRKVHTELAKKTRACAYDRAGYGFSDPGPLPRDTRHLAEDLAALTKAAALPPPYVLVGALLGGMIVRLYADTHLRDVAGMVLVDPETEHEAERLSPVSPSFLPKIKANIEALRTCLAALEAGVPAPGSKAAADCVVKPNPEFPAAVNGHFMQLTSHAPLYRESLSEAEEAIGAGSDQVAASKRSYGDIPLVVLTAPASDQPTPNGPDPEFLARGKIVMAMHDETARLSSRGVNRAVPGASHRIMLSVPQAVIEAVDEVVTEVRQKRTADVRRKLHSAEPAPQNTRDRRT
jgi:pimeloyl-ACP methyl ester carboxylesterase